MQGIGSEAIKCQNCAAQAIPSEMPCRYTMAFDHERTLEVTVGKKSLQDIARHASQYAVLPAASQQHSTFLLGKADIAALLTRMRPFIGNMGTTPAIHMPHSHNCGHFGQLLLRAPHQYRLEQAQLQARTDGHLELDSVREGEEAAPIQVIGSGADLNAATANGLQRAARLLDMSVDEVKNRVTITGAVEIGRAPGLVTVSLLAPLKQLEKLGIAHLVKGQYGL